MNELTYSRFLLPAADTHPSHLAVVDGAWRADYGTHLDRVWRLASGLARAGVGPGDRFAVMALNSHEFLEAYHAALLGGAVIVPVNLRLTDTEVRSILTDSGARLCLTDSWFAPLVDRARPPGVEQVALIGDGTGPADLGYGALLAAGEPRPGPEPGEDAPAVLMYTGGTTGRPRGAVLDQRALVLYLYKVLATWPMDDSYVWLHQAPMFHAACLGAVLGVPACAATTVTVPVFDPAAVMAAVEAEQVNCTTMVPAMVAALLDHPDFDPSRLMPLRTVIYGAAPMPETLISRLLAALPAAAVYQGYGMTENCGLLTVLGPAEHRAGGPRLRSAGRPLPGSEVSVRRLDATPAEPGEVGEVWARAGNFMTGYWGRPDETAEAFAGGWYHTGDAGYLDSDGYLYLVDRVTDMIVTGGENVYPAEVENALVSHPDVAQVAVFGVPSERWGEEVLAVVVPSPGAAPNAADLQTWARRTLAGFKVPKQVVFREEPLPLSAVMKVLRRELRAPYWTDRDRHVN